MIDKNLFAIIKDKKKFLWLNIANQVFALLLNLAITFCLIYGIKSIIENQTNLIITYLSLSTVAAIARLGSHIWSNFLANKIGDFSSKSVRHNLYKKFLNLKDSNAIKTNEMSQLSSEGIEQLKLYYAVYLPSFFFSLIAPLVLFVIMSFIDWKVSLIYLVCVPIIPGSIIAVSKWAKRIFNKYWDLYLNLGNKFFDNTNGLKELKIFNADKRALQQMDEQSENFRKITMKVLIMQLVSVTVMDLVAFGGAAIGIVISLISMRNNLDIYLVCFLVLVGAEFFIPMRTLGSAFHLAMNGATAGKKILNIFDSKEKVDGNITIDKIDELSLKNLSITISNKKILEDINIKFERNKIYSIIGESGCGKTTLVKNIMKLSDNYLGDVIINDNINLKNVTNASLYQSACYISNNTHLFNCSIRDNFKFVNHEISDEQILELLDLVKMKDFIDNNGGLDFIINENHTNLSGGQKQRIILAMYLSKKYDLYIFDEATSNIDIDSEEIFFETIKSLLKNSIVIIITHRLKNIKYTNYTYLLKDKKIYEEGVWKDLLTRNNFVGKLYQTQLALERVYENKINF